jgi:tetratricopeptide (TPR) repeat protein
MNSVDADSVRRALPHLEQAIELDPSYLNARLWLIEAYSRAEPFDPAGTSQLRGRKDALIDAIVATAPDTPLASLAMSYRAWDGPDLVQLERLLQSAMLMPGDPGNQARFRYGRLLLGLGRLEDARTQTTEALRIDPLDFFGHVRLYEILEASGDFQAAEQELMKFRGLPGGTTLNTLGGEINLSQSRGDLIGLRKAIDSILEAGVGQPFLREMKSVPLEDAAAYRKALRKQVESLGFPANVGGTTRIAQWASFFGDRDLALQALETMRRQNFSIDTMAEELWRPSIAALRNEPEFKQVLRELGVVDYWRTTGNWGRFCQPAGSVEFKCL